MNYQSGISSPPSLPPRPPPPLSSLSSPLPSPLPTPSCSPPPLQVERLSLGSLVVLVSLQALAANIACIHDASAQAYCLAVLRNTAPHATALHSVCSRRLLTVLTGLRKRHAMYAKQAADAASDAAEWVSVWRVGGWVSELCVSTRDLMRVSALVSA